MNSNDPGSGRAVRPEREHALGWLARIIDRLSRGEIPVDGFSVQERQPPKPRNPQPVRWGNFR